MYSKIIKNDIRKSRLITVTITVFILVAAMLTSLAAALAINLSGAIGHMLEEAKTPHFMQMHAGDVDEERLRRFAEAQGNVEAFQTLEFLNIEGAEIVIGENSLAESLQDNGFSVQSEAFDFLLDLSGGGVRPAEGELYVPLYYMKEGQARAGDTVTIRGVSFTVAGFLRDSQMNSALVSSKRFLVNAADFEKIRDFGIMERLIEFRLKDAAGTSDFEAAYLQAGLEANGPPAITYPLVRLMNAITDGIMIAVLALISLLVTVVAFLCIRFTLLAKIEEDYREIGVLKAVGLRAGVIKKLYMAKYALIAGIACAAGFLISLPAQGPFMENIRLYMGESDRPFIGLLFGVLGAAAIFFIVLLYVNGVLRRFRGISAAEAVRFGAPQEKSKAAGRFQLSNARILSPGAFLGIKDVLSRKKLYVTMLMVLVIASFIAVVPQNIYNTISSRSFVTYMGIGLCDMRIDIQQTQTDNVPQKMAELADALSTDGSVSKYTALTSRMFDMRADDGTVRRLIVELGDHSAFPVAYSGGRAPESDTEIAVSILNADDMGKTIGDEIALLVGDEEKRLTICGLYSDITSGGKTSKAVFKTDRGDLLGGCIAVAFHDRQATASKVSEYKGLAPFAEVSSVDEHISQMFGSTLGAIRKASLAAVCAAIALTILVTLLFMKMLVTKDRYPIAVLKSLGFTSPEIRGQYLWRAAAVLVAGVAVGTVLSNTLGEFVGVALISSFGASSFHFVVDPLFAYVFSPLLIAAGALLATLLGVSDIRSLKISDHIKEA